MSRFTYPNIDGMEKRQAVDILMAELNKNIQIASAVSSINIRDIVHLIAHYRDIWAKYSHKNIGAAMNIFDDALYHANPMLFLVIRDNGYLTAEQKQAKDN